MVKSQATIEEDGTIDLSADWIPQGFVGNVKIHECTLKPNKQIELQVWYEETLYRAQLPMWSSEIKDIAREFGIKPANWKGQWLKVDSVVIPWKGEDKVVRRLKPLPVVG